VVCSSAPDRSGHERLGSLLSLLGLEEMTSQVLYNADDESCFLLSAGVEAVHSLLLDGTVGDEKNEMTTSEKASEATGEGEVPSSPAVHLTVMPMLDLLKLPSRTAMSLLEDDWSPDLTSLTRTVVTDEFSYEDTVEVEETLDLEGWRRSILVDLLPSPEGETTSTGSEGSSLVRDVMDHVSSLADPTSDDAATSTTLREAFSLTAVHLGERARMFERHSIWSRALELGFESDHGCGNMMDGLEVRTRRNWGEESPGGSVGGFEDSLKLTYLFSKRLALFHLPLSMSLRLDQLVILHPPSDYSEESEFDSSALNRHCALSLVMALSTHPSVQTVEVGRPVVQATFSESSTNAIYAVGVGGVSREKEELVASWPHVDMSEYDYVEPSAELAEAYAGLDIAEPKIEEDSILFDGHGKFSSEERNERAGRGLQSSTPVEGKTNPQWITQSNVRNSRPFFDEGLDGSGQIVAVADGGLDVDNCYLADTSVERIYGPDRWNLNHRKVVHYDDSFGDRLEREAGHGTYVSGILSGRRSVGADNNESAGHADGAAPGSRLAFFDMEVGSRGIDDPGIERLLQSLVQGGTSGARVLNASWGRSYGGRYSSFCREVDAALRSTYPDLLFVLSAGNTGRADGASSIQNPGDCKNSLAVGATLNEGSDARNGERGVEYLADYSSRGPTLDGRVKPDLVAPGHFMLAPMARPDEAGECDGGAQPSVQAGFSGGDGVKYTTGTSMAAPALAGSAAILRQYFEEGYCKADGDCCGTRGCGAAINASGSLLKAALMNGAQPLTGGVQFVPSGDVLQDQPLSEYDSNQGFGRVNLVKSVSLKNRNKISTLAINDKWLQNGKRDVYRVIIDKSDGCDEDLRATLAWYDPPGPVGCTKCLVNDLDLWIKDGLTMVHPNGRNFPDTTNNVERIRTQPEVNRDGQEMRIFVNAKNLAFNGQKYSLVVTGCFTRQDLATKPVDTARAPAVEERPAVTTTRPPLMFEMIDTKLGCPNERLFKLELNTSTDGEALAWDLAMSTADNGIEMVASGTGYSNFATITKKLCLDAGRRYRF
ncbi:hypothetical protein THAOC_32238, partial [Thalassiosira oceanica]